jgi:homoserine kinase type II
MAVYTEVSDEELTPFIASYGLGELLSFKGIAEGVENSNYIVVTTKGQYVLTLYEKRVAPEDLPFFLGLMEHLAAVGFTCPTPIRDLEGRNLRSLCERPAALVSYLEGLWIRRPLVEHCERAGEALAQLHLAGQSFEMRRENALGPAGWQPLFDKFAAQADEISRGLGRAISDEIAAVKPMWPRALPEGVIHADLFPDNLFFLGRKVSGVIDFYFACNDLLAYDIAICLNAWCFEKDLSFNVTKSRALLRGYQAVRPLEHAERDALPVLCRGAALRFLLTRAYDWLHTSQDALVKPHDPAEYLRRLRFHQTARSAGAYGVETAA